VSVLTSFELEMPSLVNSVSSRTSNPVK